LYGCAAAWLIDDANELCEQAKAHCLKTWESGCYRSNADETKCVTTFNSLSAHSSLLLEAISGIRRVQRILLSGEANASLVLFPLLPV